MKTITYNPETHVLVPREPSDEMLRKAIKIDLGKDCDEKGICINLYQVMLAAAPQPEPNPNWCAGCSPDNCSGCGAEPVESEPAMWVMKHIRSGDLAQAKPNQKALHPYMWSDAFPRYTTPQPDRTAELEAALKVAKAALNRAADKFHDYAEIHAAKEASPENDLKVERNLMLSSDMDKALAKINEVLHD